MRATDRITLAVTLSLFLASFTLVPLTSDRSYLGASWGLLVALGTTTVLLRRARVGSGLVLLAQVGVGSLLSLGLSFTMQGLGLPWWQHYLGLWQGGVLHMQEQASPMDPNDGVTLIFTTIVAGLFVFTDLLAAGLARPAWALVPPATLFLVPALGLGTDIGVSSFLLIGVGYLGILVADGLNSSHRWTRGLSRDSAETVGAAPVVWRAAALIGVPALIGTLLLGALLPTLSLPGVGFGGGTGGNGPLQLTDPSLDLRRNLNQPQDKVVLTYQTNESDGLYLRLASLPQFDAAGWSAVQIRLNSGNQLPQPPGLTEGAQDQHDTRIQVRDFRSQYLPLPYAPTSFDAPGDWRYDANSLTVVDGEEEADALPDLSYSVRHLDVAPPREGLADAAAGTPLDASITAAVPDDLPEDLIRLSEQVVDDAGATTPADKAAAIQSFLRGSDFEYTVEPLPGNGYRALQNFLLRDRKGYCEQFAASMAMMARIVGIPSRVSVGFLPGERKGDTWEVSIQKMHAWPELYFAGYGWVRFEPTPAQQTGSAPSWTLESSDDPASSPSEAPTAAPSASTSAPSSAPQDVPTEQTTSADTTASFPWAQTLLGTAVGLLVVAVLAAPATLRVRRRSSRLSGDQLADEQVEAAWAEIRDTVLDYGGSWPSGSPRVIGTEIGHRLEGEESAAMSQVATLVERSRYARQVGDPAVTATLPELTGEIRRGLAAPLTRRQRLQGLVLPRSLFRRRPGG